MLAEETGDTKRSEDRSSSGMWMQRVSHMLVEDTYGVTAHGHVPVMPLRCISEVISHRGELRFPLSAKDSRFAPLRATKQQCLPSSLQILQAQSDAQAYATGLLHPERPSL